MKIPLLDLKAQYAVIKDEIKKVVDEVLESQIFILGPKVEELEKNIAAYSQTEYAVGVSSGTDALLISLMALDIQPGDEVITTPFTFFSTAGVVSRLCARPVFIDIDPVTCNINPAKLERAITKKTRAIIPVHLFGQCADMDPILAVAQKLNIPVIEDAAQSIGAEYKGRKAGSIGRLGILSFFPSKNLGGAGDGGMVLTNDKALHEKIKVLRVHGSKPKYYHRIVGGNFRLDALQAAVLNVKLKYLDDWSRRRRANADYYDKKLKETGLRDKGIVKTPVPVFKAGGDKNHGIYEQSIVGIKDGDNLQGIHGPGGDKNYHIYNQYTIRAKDRNGLQAFLKDAGIGTEVYYPVPLHLQECFKDLGFKKGDFPVAEEAAGSVLSLPVYPELTDEQKDYVVEKIAAFYG